MKKHGEENQGTFVHITRGDPPLIEVRVEHSQVDDTEGKIDDWLYVELNYSFPRSLHSLRFRRSGQIILWVVINSDFSLDVGSRPKAIAFRSQPGAGFADDS